MTAVLWVPETPPAAEWDVWEFSRWGPWLSVRLLHVLLYLASAFLLDQVWRMLLRIFAERGLETLLMQRSVILDASAGRSGGQGS